VRFWESPSYFVVLGFSKVLAREVYEEECAALKLPIFRRVSGGGTVLQGPGCLNYTLVLPVSFAPQLETITGANRLIMERNRSAVAALAQKPVTLQGHTDLTLDGRKFSGNAQRRKKSSVLFHGSFLLSFDLGLISRALRIPADQPEYRKERPHSDFLLNLNVPPEALKQALAALWRAQESPAASLLDEALAQTRLLAQSKYADPGWNRRF
jgi:lipoate-protein ligase A